MAAKMATIVGDITGLQQHHQPLKVKLFQDTQTYEKLKLRAGVQSTPPPPPLFHCPLYHCGGMNLCVCPRVKIIF